MFTRIRFPFFARDKRFPHNAVASRGARARVVCTPSAEDLRLRGKTTVFRPAHAPPGSFKTSSTTTSPSARTPATATSRRGLVFGAHVGSGRRPVSRVPARTRRVVRPSGTPDVRIDRCDRAARDRSPSSLLSSRLGPTERRQRSPFRTYT